MSMTLKKGQKAFKPKFPARRPGGSTPSSARPSIERQSQTPVPPTRLSELTIIPDRDGDSDLHGEASAIQPISRPSIVESLVDLAQQDIPNQGVKDASSTDKVLKRKVGSEGDTVLAQKRTRLHASKPSSNAESPENEGVFEDSRRNINDVYIAHSGTNHSQDTLSHDASQVLTTGGTAIGQPQTPQIEVSSRQTPQETSHSAIHDTTSIAQVHANANVSSSENIVTIPADKETYTHPARAVTTNASIQKATYTQEGTTSRHATPEVRQDNPSSVYPDPELSGIPLIRTGGGGRLPTTVASVSLNLDGPTIGQIVPSAALNPDGTSTSNIVPAVALSPDGTPRGALVQEPTKAKKKGPTKRRRIILAGQGDDVRPTIEMQLHRPRRTEGPKRVRKKKDEGKRRKKRGETPDGAEDEIIDRSEMTMAELCKDLKIGEKSSRHEQMKEQMNAAKLKAKEIRLAKKLAATRVRQGEGTESSPVVEGAGEAQGNTPAAEIPATPEPEEPRTGGIRYMNLDGELVIDPRSMEVRREDPTSRKGGRKDWAKQIAQKENEFSTIVTSGSYMKREPAQLWSENDTDIFYKALAMFGPNFEMMAKMFPSRNRRQIKLKYAKEERDNPWRVDKVEKGPKMPIDFDLFQEHCPEKMVEVEEIEAELQAYADEEQQNEEAMRKERLAVEEQKKATIKKLGSFAARRALDTMSDDGENENSQSQPFGPREASAAPKSKKKVAPTKRTKNNSHAGSQDPNNYTVVGRTD